MSEDGRRPLHRINLREASVKPGKPKTIAPRPNDDWRGELRPWSEATLQQRKARRPEGWRTTPEQLRELAPAAGLEIISQICRMYQPLVNEHLRAKPGVSLDAANEATQEVFLALLKRKWLSKLILTPETSFGSWLVSRACYSLRKHWRREKKPKRLLCPPLVDETTSRQFEERKAKLHHELSTEPEERHDLKTPEDILAKACDAKLLERLFARIEPNYTRRKGGLFERLKAKLLEAGDADTELKMHDSEKSRMRKELQHAAFFLEREDQRRNPSRPLASQWTRPARRLATT